jgi:hypothetical protein
MRLTDADAIIKEQREIMEKMYCSTIPELKKHMSIDDDLSIYIHCMEQFSRAKQFYHGLRGILENAPTVDAVVVTRCKNCKDFHQNNENDPYCANRHGLDDPVPDGFCNYGKPKEASDER